MRNRVFVQEKKYLRQNYRATFSRVILLVMHVFIDARGLENKIDGIGQFTIQIINRLSDRKNHGFSVLIRDDLALPLPSAPNITYLKTALRRFTLREGSAMASLVASARPDLYFNTSPYIPARFRCKRVMMLYDLLSTHFKGHFKGMGFFKEFFARRYFRHQTRSSLSKADHVITISDFSRKKIRSQYDVSESRITVAYGGVDKQYDSSVDDAKRQEFLGRLGLEQGFFLHVGNLKPYKNITNIIKTFAAFVGKHPQSRQRFVFTGNRGRGYDDAVRLIAELNLNDRVKMLGYLDAMEIPLLYTSSAGLFFPSLEEGEGLPVLEAMCCRTPVVTSRGTATEEIAGGYAFLVDPCDPASLLEGLEYLAFSEKDKNRIDSACAHAKKFTWAKTVDVILGVLLEK
jgi:glycosyltransferase involved in cell wall biosynthesis